MSKHKDSRPPPAEKPSKGLDIENERQDRL